MDIKGLASMQAKSARPREFTWDRRGMTDTPFSRSDPTVCENVRSNGAHKPKLDGNGTALFASPSLLHHIPHSIVIVCGSSALGDDLFTACETESKKGRYVKRLCTGAAGTCTLQFLRPKADTTRSFVRTKEWVLLHVTLFGAEHTLEERPTQQAVAPSELNPMLLHNHLKLDSRAEKVEYTRRLAYQRRSGLSWTDVAHSSIADLDDQFRILVKVGKDDARRIELMALSMFFYAAASHFHYYNDPAFSVALYDYFVERVYHVSSPRRVLPSSLCNYTMARQSSCFDEMEEKACHAREILREWRKREFTEAMRLAARLSDLERFGELGAVFDLAQCLKVASVSVARPAPTTESATPRRVGGRIVDLEDVYSALLKGQYTETERVSAFTKQWSIEALTCLEFCDVRVDEANLRRALDSQLACLSSAPQQYVLVRYTRIDSHPAQCVILPNEVLRACNLVAECARRFGRAYSDGQRQCSLAAPVATACCQTKSAILNKAAATCLSIFDSRALPRRVQYAESLSVPSETRNVATFAHQLAWSGITRRIRRHETTQKTPTDPLPIPDYEPAAYALAIESRTPTGSPFTFLSDIDSLLVLVDHSFQFSMTAAEVKQYEERRRHLPGSRFIQSCLSRWQRAATSFEFWPTKRPMYGTDDLPPPTTGRLRSQLPDAKAELEAAERRQKEHEQELQQEQDLATAGPGQPPSRSVIDPIQEEYLLPTDGEF